MVKNAECEEKNFNLIQNFGEKQLVQKSLKKQQSSQFIKKERKLFEEKWKVSDKELLWNNW